VILQVVKSVVVELGVAAYDAAGVDQGDATAERRARRIGERVGVDAGLPLDADDPGFTSELATGLLRQSVAEPVSGEDDNTGDESKNENQRTDEESFGEGHALRECPLLSR
jgi:hypothetical protein